MGKTVSVGATRRERDLPIKPVSQSLRSCNELRRAGRVFLMPALAPVWTLREGDNTHPLPPRRRHVDQSPGSPFWADAFLLFELFRGSFQDQEVLCDLLSLMSCRSKFTSFLGAIPRAASVVDVVLTQPEMRRDLMDAEVSGGPLDLPTFANKRNCMLTKFWWVAGHRGEPSMKAIH